MTIFNCRAAPITRGKGRSLAGAIAYQCRTKLTDTNTGRVLRYTAKEDLVFTDILLPADAPEWMKSHKSLIAGLEAAEGRKDSRTAMSLTLSIPREIPQNEWQKFSRDFIHQEITAKGFVAVVAAHNPGAADGREQPHLHVVFSTRALDSTTETGLSVSKSRYLYDPASVRGVRERFAAYTNGVLQRLGSTARVTELSLKDQRKIQLDRAIDPRLSANERDIARLKADLLNRPPEKTLGYRSRNRLKLDPARPGRERDTEILDTRKAVKKFERNINYMSLLAGAPKKRSDVIGEGKNGQPSKEQLEELEAEQEHAKFMLALAGGIEAGIKLSDILMDGSPTNISESNNVNAPGTPSTSSYTPDNIAPPSTPMPIKKPGEVKLSSDEESQKYLRRHMNKKSRTAQKYAIRDRQNNAPAMPSQSSLSSITTPRFQR